MWDAGRFMQMWRAMCAAIDRVESITGRSVATAARVSSSGASEDALCTRASVSSSEHRLVSEFNRFYCSQVELEAARLTKQGGTGVRIAVCRSVSPSE